MFMQNERAGCHVSENLESILLNELIGSIKCGLNDVDEAGWPYVQLAHETYFSGIVYVSDFVALTSEASLRACAMN